MAKTVKDKKLDTPTARAKLAPSGVPYWRSLDSGLHIGYRKGKTGGVWVLRRYLGAGSYRVENIGKSDDHGKADGHTIIDFFQAQRRAREVAAQAAVPTGAAGFTVAKAMAAYLTHREQGGKRNDLPTIGRINGHILPVLGETLVSDLSCDLLDEWRAGLALAAGDDDKVRASRCSANRTLAILRAALNLAFQKGKATSDAAWRRVKPFGGTDAPRERFLTDDESRRVVNAAQGSFRALVKAALFTACRYGELCNLRAGDFNGETETIHITKSKSGKKRDIALDVEGAAFFRALAAGKPRTAFLLTRDDGQPWSASDQSRLMTRACRAASIEPAIGIHILRHTIASRMAKAGVSMTMIAAHLGHANTRMTEKHYAHLAPSHVAETIRRLTPALGIGDATNIVPMEAKRGK
jgi:integrase